MTCLACVSVMCLCVVAYVLLMHAFALFALDLSGAAQPTNDGANSADTKTQFTQRKHARHNSDSNKRHKCFAAVLPYENLVIILQDYVGVPWLQLRRVITANAEIGMDRTMHAMSVCKR